MTTDITITGTGVPIPAPGVAGPGVLVRHNDVLMQFDVGRNTLGRLTEIDVDPQDLSAVFVSHHHSDHLVGLVDLVMTRWVMHHADHKQLTIVVPRGPSLSYVESMLDPWDDDITVRMEHVGRDDRPSPMVRAFDAPSTPTEIWAEGDVSVLAVTVHHEPVTPSVGFRIETPDGVVVISGDTRVCDEVGELSRGASVVVHEAMRTNVMRHFFGVAPQLQQISEYHADTVELGAMAERVKIPHLVLTHLIPFVTTDADRQGFADDLVAGGYTGQVTVARDLTTITI
ncbi:MAG: MBL fold metallo-hydrolase [Actinomycetia bacterium]|nr:MBL fold metallo-hydrolase [Actinomycetes bacterium]MCP4226854.1 MBL fold metallo-hydrolase [Actinomycetes bacterium]MCP5030993.1 MBL fold metallo-hydrolase [Actinomycetes bacterium]